MLGYVIRLSGSKFFGAELYGVFWWLVGLCTRGALLLVRCICGTPFHSPASAFLRFLTLQPGVTPTFGPTQSKSAMLPSGPISDLCVCFRSRDLELCVLHLPMYMYNGMDRGSLHRYQWWFSQTALRGLLRVKTSVSCCSIPAASRSMSNCMATTSG